MARKRDNSEWNNAVREILSQKAIPVGRNSGYSKSGRAARNQTRSINLREQKMKLLTELAKGEQTQTGETLRQRLSDRTSVKTTGMAGRNQLANTKLSGQNQLANTGLTGQNQLQNTELMGQKEMKVQNFLEQGRNARSLLDRDANRQNTDLTVSGGLWDSGASGEQIGQLMKNIRGDEFSQPNWDIKPKPGDQGEVKPYDIPGVNYDDPGTVGFYNTRSGPINTQEQAPGQKEAPAYVDTADGKGFTITKTGETGTYITPEQIKGANSGALDAAFGTSSDEEKKAVSRRVGNSDAKSEQSNKAADRDAKASGTRKKLEALRGRTVIREKKRIMGRLMLKRSRGKLSEEQSARLKQLKKERQAGWK